MNQYLSRLSSLIIESRDQIIDQWKAAVCKLPGARHLEDPLLMDHMPQLLDELSTALTKAQSVSLLEMTPQKSAIQHGAVRFKLGFDVEEVIAEFGLLRDIMQQFAEASGVNISGEVNRTVNRVVDKAIAASLETYVRQQAEETERKRQEYLSFVVHDLKTPISAIAATTQVIDRKIRAENPAVVSDMIDILRRNTIRLNDRVMEIINEESRLQALSSNAHPRLQLGFRDVDLWPIAERFKRDFEAIADSQGNKVRNEVPPELRVFADPELLAEALQNLLSNALKYTSGGEITIGGVDNADSIVCWIKDTGIGIPADRINEIFRKGTSDPRNPESTGLGLAIVEKVMQLHGGRVTVESTPGKGSTFRIEFPKPHTKVA